jgi:hypothetical protein
MWTLYRRSDYYVRGVPDDGSESWSGETRYHLIRTDEDEAFQEDLAADYGNQDYSYRVRCDRVASFKDNEELKKAFECISQRIFLENLKEE